VEWVGRVRAHQSSLDRAAPLPKNLDVRPDSPDIPPMTPPMAPVTFPISPPPEFLRRESVVDLIDIVDSSTCQSKHSKL